MRVDPETEARCRATVTHLAVDAFKDHQLTQVREGLWKCARPDRWTYGFFVAAMPDAIACYGDTPDALLRVYPCGSVDAAVAWLRGATRSPEYLFEKLTSKDAWQVFYRGDALRTAREWSRDYADDMPGKYDRLVAEVVEAGDDLTHETWCELCHELAVDDAYSVGVGWDASAFLLIEAFSTFVRLYDAGAEIHASPASPLAAPVAQVETETPTLQAVSA